VSAGLEYYVDGRVHAYHALRAHGPHVAEGFEVRYRLDVVGADRVEVADAVASAQFDVGIRYAERPALDAKVARETAIELVAVDARVRIPLVIDVRGDTDAYPAAVADAMQEDGHIAFGVPQYRALLVYELESSRRVLIDIEIRNDRTFSQKT
jgi:hypothetical protein